MLQASGLSGHTTLYTQLTTHLRETGSALSPADVTALAVDSWLRAAKDAPPAVAPQELRGYQWKCLFLPHGSDLRMLHEGVPYCARVIGDHIIYQGRRLSPRGLTLAIAGPGRNAWRTLLIRLPGEKHWQLASVCRRAVLAAASRPIPAPSDTMAAAATSMSDALRTVLALVSHVKAESLKRVERRNEHHRRASDIMEEDCRLD